MGAAARSNGTRIGPGSVWPRAAHGVTLEHNTCARAVGRVARGCQSRRDYMMPPACACVAGAVLSVDIAAGTQVGGAWQCA